MSEEENHDIWSELVHLPLINRMKEAFAERWGVSLHFTDTKGWLQGIEPGKFFKPANPVCTAICSTERGFQDRKASALSVTANVLGSRQNCVATCTTGISILAMPIILEDKAIGAVYADGFMLENTKGQQVATLKNYLERNVDDNDILIQQVEQLACLSDKDVVFLTALITSISEQLVDLNQRYRKATQSIHKLTGEILGDQDSVFPGIIGRSAAMKEVYVMLDKVKDSTAPILVTGENGTGKELVAKNLHFQSKRKKSPFLALNCGAFNETLLDSELFGHVKGSFTGATGNKKGLLEECGEGTLFLDELGEMPLSMQVKLLRVLQEGTFMPVGSTKEKTTKARIVCATNRDLGKMIKKGLFRQDLYYRLDVINIRIPSLRERADDIPLLVQHFAKKFDLAEGFSLPEEVLNALQEYSWPGNIRQLENEIQRLSIVHGKGEVSIKDLSNDIQSELQKSKGRFKLSGELKNSVENYEKALIIEGMKKHNGNKSALAKELGISRPSLIKKIKKYGLVS